MICKKCEASLPEGSTVCPICRTPLILPKTRKASFTRAIILLSPFLCFLTVAINLYIILVAGHYPGTLNSDFAGVLQLLYAIHPILQTVNWMFAALFVFSFGLTIFSLYRMQKRRRIGPILLAFSHGLALLGTVFYPTVFCAVTETSSPILLLTVILAIVYTVLAAATTVYLFRTRIFYY